MQDLLPYAALLKSLEIHGFWDSALIADWPSLTRFSSLESLKLVYKEVSLEGFYAAVQKMHHLTELEISCTTNDYAPVPVSFVPSFTQLRSLLLEPAQNRHLRVACNSTEAFTAMTQLTRLVVERSLCGSSFSCLTKLIELEIVGHSPMTTFLPQALSCMPHLTSLKINKCGEPFALPPEVVRPLTKLKTLQLWKVDPIASSFFAALAALPGLTELSFLPGLLDEGDHVFFAQLTLLSRLAVLTVSCRWALTEDRIRLMGGCLPRLQKMLFVTTEFDRKKWYRQIATSLEETVSHSALIRAFPCLRHICLVRFPFRAYPHKHIHLTTSAIELFDGECKLTTDP